MNYPPKMLLWLSLPTAMACADVDVKATNNPMGQLEEEESWIPPVFELPQEEEPDPLWMVRFNTAHFKASHDSYQVGRGGIIQQLDAGVRMLELDIHDDDFANHLDYRIGLDGPDHAIGPDNPAGPYLRTWLDEINAWSDANPDHAPLTIVLDTRDDFVDNQIIEQGHVGLLNTILTDSFGDKLYPAYSLLGGWPTVNALRGRIVSVLAGKEINRQHYKRTVAESPSITVNDNGQVMATHHDGDQNLWVWTGHLKANGEIHWVYNARYDAGKRSAIDLNNHGHFVEVHQGSSSRTVWYLTGQLDSDGIPQFNAPTQYESGRKPSIRFIDKDGFDLHEIHRGAYNDDDWEMFMTLSTDGSLQVGSASQTVNSHDKKSQAGIDVSTAYSNTAGIDTLLYSPSNSVLRRRVRYPQLMHIDLDNNDGGELNDAESRFLRLDSGQASAVDEAYLAGTVTRLRGFLQEDIYPDLNSPTFPATDTPLDSWYADYCLEIGCLE